MGCCAGGCPEGLSLNRRLRAVRKRFMMDSVKGVGWNGCTPRKATEVEMEKRVKTDTVHHTYYNVRVSGSFLWSCHIAEGADDRRHLPVWISSHFVRQNV